jgi:cytochrome c peroxidase
MLPRPRAAGLLGAGLLRTGLLCADLLCAGCRPLSPGSDPAGRAWREGLARLDARLAVFQRSARDPSVPADSLRAAFRSARLAYKRIEFLWAAAYPREARLLDGPAVDEVEQDDEHTVVPPHGFQVLEARLHPRILRDSLAPEAEGMRALARDPVRAEAVWSDSALAEAARLEWLRIGSLGLTGYDSPLALQSLPGSRAALEGMAAVLDARFLRGRTGNAAGRAYAAWRDALRAAITALPASSDSASFAAFDRAGFLSGKLGPAYAAWIGFRDAAGIPPPAEPLAYSPRARGPFEAAWDAAAFAPPFSRRTNADGVALGRSLFFDPAFSADGSRSCASCHRPEHAYSDPRARAVKHGGRGTLARHAPSLLYAGFQNAAFWDGRAESLEDQADQVVRNPEEMGGSWDAVTRRLAADGAMRERFRAAFREDAETLDRDEPVSPLRIRRALAAYVRSLAPFASPFDRFLRGDTAALTAEARAGFNLFAGKARCATCHFPPLFNGAVPPTYAGTDREVLGVPERPRGPLDPDPGAGALDHRPQSLRAFKTPTVRDAARKAPYMHNGAFASLEEVIDFYDAGGGAGAGLDVPNQTLPRDPLHLAPAEKRALIAFLYALGDAEPPPGEPSQARYLPNGR